CESVLYGSLFFNQESKLVQYLVKSVANFDSKDDEDNSMLQYYCESKPLQMKSSRALKSLWSNLNWFKSKSGMSSMDNRHCGNGSIMRTLSFRRTNLMSTCVFAHQSIGLMNLIEWKPKGVRWLSYGTGSLPKGRNFYGKGRLIVVDQNPLNSGYSSLIMRKDEGVRFYSSVKTNSLESSGLNVLTDIQTEAKNNSKVTNLYKRGMLNQDLFITAYEKISNKGGITLDKNNNSLDSYPLTIIQKTIAQLKDHQFKFKPLRKEYITKNNGKLSIFGIASPRDKLVQQVMVFILQSIYEQFFLDSNHGFRPNKSTHTALKKVASWHAIDWVIEGDIQSYFNQIDQHTLINFLTKRIDDQEFIDLCWKACRAGYFEVKESRKFDLMVGTPKGSILSPILSNIYLHEFDLYMENKVKLSLDSGPSSRRFTPYRKLESKIGYIYQLSKKQGYLTKDQLSRLKTLNTERAKLPSSIGGPGYRIYYVRYTDDFLVGINGSLNLTLELKSEIKNFLADSLKLNLNIDKTKITNIKDNKALFLGAEIYRIVSRTNDSKVVTKKSPLGETYSKGGIKSRISNSRTSLLIPIKMVVSKLANQNFCIIKDYNQGQIKPMGKVSWINLSLYDIVLRYNAVLIGFVNYYSFAANRCRLQLIQYILQHSCAKLIAQKLNLNSRAKVFKKFGYYIRVQSGNKSTKLKLSNSYKQITKFNINSGTPLEEVYWSLRTKSKLNLNCIICNSNQNVEMHHVKALKNSLKPKGIKTTAVTLNRKQIPVCKACHNKIHNGTYDSLNLRKIEASD
uniref:hypothetical protein n=1 Tax=Schizosaccharomyces osmophilus TaxID=2545709 RepID=UPI00237B0FCE